MEKKKRIFFYGDSNTYGFDPADFVNGRYPETERFTGILKRTLSGEWEIDVNALNGRRLPDLTWEETRIDQMLYRLRDEEIFAVMLGTNDILCTSEPDAEKAIEKMRLFLAHLVSKRKPSWILVIAPPYPGADNLTDPLFFFSVPGGRQADERGV